LFQFLSVKNLGGFGDGGMITTNDAELPGKSNCCAITATVPSITTKSWAGIFGSTRFNGHPAGEA
jgi:dTDP-4-amino-4,6-dideoxygalactose transaminase